MEMVTNSTMDDTQSFIVISLVADVAYIRSKWQMCGCLSGTLPQAQQQNIFLGLPLQLMVEEVALLVEHGAAIIVDDKAFHDQTFTSMSSTDKVAFLEEIEFERNEIALAGMAEARERRQVAIENAKKSGKWKSRDKTKQCVPEYSFLETDDESLMTRKTTEMISTSSACAKDVSLDNVVQVPERIMRQFVIPMKTYVKGSLEISSQTHLMSAPKPSVSRYEVYKHLQSLGYFLSPGLRFGCEFMAYPGDPLRFHSHFLVKSFDYDQEIPVMDLVGGGRLGTGVKKAWMMAGLSSKLASTVDTRKEAEPIVRCFCIEWGGFG